MALTPEQLAQIRRMIGDTATPSTFSDAEIEASFAAAGELVLPTVVALIDELLISAARLTDYTQNASSEKRSQVFEQLLKMRGVFQDRIDKAAAAGTRQVVIAATIAPKRKKDTP